MCLDALIFERLCIWVDAITAGILISLCAVKTRMLREQFIFRWTDFPAAK